MNMIFKIIFHHITSDNRGNLMPITLVIFTNNKIYHKSYLLLFICIPLRPFKYNIFDDEDYQEVCIKNWAIEHLLGYIEDMKTLFKKACNDRVKINITKPGTGARCGETLRVAKLQNVSSSRHANKDLNPLDYADKTNMPDFDLDLD